MDSRWPKKRRAHIWLSIESEKLCLRNKSWIVSPFCGCEISDTHIQWSLYRHMLRSCISRKLNWTSDVCDGCAGCWIENFSENWLNPSISVIFNSTAEADQHIHRMMWHFRCSGCSISWPCIRQTCWQLIRSMRINVNVWTSAVHE